MSGWRTWSVLNIIDPDHPIQIGNYLHERYRIVHKLGYGSFSTVWLARDEQASKYVAVKLCTADAI
jgi:hypothetical protein